MKIKRERKKRKKKERLSEEKMRVRESLIKEKRRKERWRLAENRLMFGLLKSFLARRQQNIGNNLKNGVLPRPKQWLVS